MDMMDDEAFSRLMADCGPFEAAPVVAVAVSGGADSMALALLAQGWAAARGGRAVAFTVDHGLRPESAGEARQVHAWMAARGIDHDILNRSGPMPKGTLQAAARRLRYDLLLAACRARGIVHLLLAHQAEDQAETMAMRTARSAEATAMSAVSPPPVPGPRWPRLVRPLLPMRKGLLRDYLSAQGQAWIEDPSNENPAFERVRVRRRMTSAPGEIPGYLQKADENQRLRQEQAAALGRVAPSLVTFHATGWAEVDRDAYAQLAPHLQVLLWRRLLGTIGGREHAPRGRRLMAFLANIKADDFTAATLGGCRIQRRKENWLVCREPGGMAEQPGQAPWDGRFTLSAAPGSRVSRLTETQWRDLKKNVDWEALKHLPHVVRLSLPVELDAAGGVHPPVFTGCGQDKGSGARAAFTPALPFLY